MTAGNSTPPSDAAAALIPASPARAGDLGVHPASPGGLLGCLRRRPTDGHRPGLSATASVISVELWALGAGALELPDVRVGGEGY